METPSLTPQAEFTQGEGNADVIFVRAEQSADGTWTFSVTVSHPDTGWEDYADGWDVILPDGIVLKPDPQSPFTRLLLHPHVNQQPFTRSQSGITIPEGETVVIVRAHDLVDGFGGQVVVVDLTVSQGNNFEVIHPISIQQGVLGLTNHNLDGNRYLPGTINILASDPIDILLAGTPLWVVGLPQAGNSVFWLVALEDGSLQAFTVFDGSYTTVPLPVQQLDPGTPPAIRTTESGFELLNILVSFGSSLSSPISLAGGELAYISPEGDLVIESPSGINTVSVDALPDGRMIGDSEGSLILLSEPSSIYGHGILGDGLEPRSITLVENVGEAQVETRIEVPGGQVIEGLAPIWTDLDGDGEREIIVTLSDERDGARLVVYSQQGEIIARSRAIGTGYRWRHQIAAAPFGPNGEIEIVDVLTPHIGGVVEFFQVQGSELVKVAQVSGYSSHQIGSRNLDMALAADVDADGQVEVLLPNQNLTSLGIIGRTEEGAGVEAEIRLEDVITTNIGAVSLDDGSLALAVGLQSGVLRIWLP